MNGETAATGSTGTAARGHFRLTEADLLEADRALRWHRRIITFAIVSLYAVIEIGLLVATLAAGSGTAGAPARGLLTDGMAFEIVVLIGNLLLAAFLLYYFIASRLFVRRRIRRFQARSGAEQIEQRITIDTAGFTIASARGAQHYDWHDIDWCLAGKSVIVLRSFHDWIILPTRIASEDVAAHRTASADLAGAMTAGPRGAEAGIDLAAFMAHFRQTADPVRELAQRPPRPSPLFWPFRALWRLVRHARRRANQQSKSAAGTEVATGAGPTAANASGHAIYQLTIDDLAAFAAAMAPRLNPSYLMLLAICVGNIYAAGTMLHGEKTQEAWMLICFLLFHFPLVGLLTYSFRQAFTEPRRRLRQHAVRGKLETTDFTAERDADGLRLSNIDWWRRIRWDELRWWRRTPRLLLLHAGSTNQTYLLPVSIAASGFDLTALTDRLASLMPEGKRAARQQQAAPPAAILTGHKASVTQSFGTQSPEHHHSPHRL